MMNQSQEREYNAHEACIAQTTTLFEVKLRIRIRSLYTTGGVLEREGRLPGNAGIIIISYVQPSIPPLPAPRSTHISAGRPTVRHHVLQSRRFGVGIQSSGGGRESSQPPVVVVVGVQAAQRQNGWWGTKAELTVQQWRGDVQLCMCCCRVGERCDIVLFAVA